MIYIKLFIIRILGKLSYHHLKVLVARNNKKSEEKNYEYKVGCRSGWSFDFVVELGII